MVAMTLGAQVRRVGFWGLDRVRGGPIRDEYEDIKAKMSGERPAGSQLQHILDHATRTTDYYRPYSGTGLEAFPVIDRTQLKQHDRLFRSTAFDGPGLHTRSTSGSTGTPVAIEQDARKRNRSIADTIYFNETVGFHLGDRLLWMQAWQLHPSSRLDLLRKNVIAIDILRLDDEVRKTIVGTLLRDSVKCVLGFPSVLGSLARYLEANSYQPEELGLRVVISSAETLQPEVKRRIEVAFGCPVVNRYASEECGILACSRPGDDRLYLNRASFHFEFLQVGKDEPATSGDLARVIVTDLYNFAVPLIRYDTGDLAIVDELGSPESGALRSIEGRQADVVYDTVGSQIPSTAVSYLMALRFVDLAQYQLVQDDATAYRLRVALGATDHPASAFSEALHGLLGADAQIKLEFLDEIPSESSGKYRPVICRYVPDGQSSTMR
ncbi:MAG: hypothetical protein U9O18_03660 [Chloroflexota bacterium]|nr:hypothetical protein [Chloroflexota bacterium]